MAKKNDTTLKNSINKSEITVEELMKQLEEIEISISSGNIAITEQINMLNHAKELHKKIKEKLQEARTTIDIEDNQ